MKKPDPNAPPKGLSVEAGAVWRRVLADYNLDDAAGRAILATGLEAFDRMRAAQAEIRKHGVVVENRFGELKPNPAVGIERDSRTGMLSSFRLLRLDPGVADDRR
jgi:P27 family predicted phage terminase small subunit